jgi:hypothetical protein
MLRRTGALALSMAWICACSGPRDGAPVDGSIADAGTSFDGGPRSDAGELDRDGAVRPVETCGGDAIAVGHSLAGFGELYLGRSTYAAVQRTEGRIVALPANVSPQVSRITYVELEPDEAEVDATVHTAVVAGEAPAGEIYHTVWLPSLDRFVMLTLERDPLRYALYALDLHESRADFTRLSETGTPSAEGSVFTGFHAMSGARVAAVRAGTDLHYVDLAGDSATWSGPMTPFGDPGISVTTRESDGGALLGWGRRTFDPMTLMEGFEPRLYEIPLSPGSPSEIPAGFGAPTAAPGVSYPFLAYDDVSRRVLVTSDIVETHPVVGMIRRPALYAFDRDLSRWTMLADYFDTSTFAYGVPYAMHADSHRAFGFSREGLSALDTETGEVTELVFDGHPGPREAVAATALEDGVIAAVTRYGEIITIDPRLPNARYEPLGEVRTPEASRTEPSLVYDPTTSSLLLFGGTEGFPGDPSAALHRIALDGTRIDEETIGGGPSARFGHQAIVHEGTMYVVGGSGATEGVAEQHGDVWALDLASRSWRRLAEVRPRSRISLAVAGGELFIAGGLRYTETFEATWVAEIEAIDLATGAVRTVATTGVAPRAFASTVALGRGFASFDLVDDVLDGTGARLRYLDLDIGAWSDLGACFVDRVVYGLQGVVMPDVSYLVGPHVIELRALE